MNTVPPELIKGYDVVYEKEVCFFLVSSEENSSNEEIFEPRILKTRILSKGEADIKIELTDDQDIAFLYQAELDGKQFEKFKEDFNLLVDFNTFIETVELFFDKSIKESHIYRSTFYINKEEPYLKFSQTLKLRVVDVFSIPIAKMPEEYVMELAQYRFNTIKDQLNAKTSELDAAFVKLDTKNPSLSRRVRAKVANVE